MATLEREVQKGSTPRQRKVVEMDSFRIKGNEFIRMYGVPREMNGIPKDVANGKLKSDITVVTDNYEVRLHQLRGREVPELRTVANQAKYDVLNRNNQAYWEPVVRKLNTIEQYLR